MTTIQQWSGPRLANVNTTGEQRDGDITALPDGNLVVTWQDGSTGQVYFRIFDAEGQALTDDILVTQGFGFSFRSDPSIAALSTGGFAITVETTDVGGNYLITTVIYDAGGVVQNGVGQSSLADGTTFTESFSVNDQVWMLSDRLSDIGLYRVDETGSVGFTLVDAGPSEAPDGVQLAGGNVAMVWENNNSTQIEFQIINPTTLASVLPGGNAIPITINGSTVFQNPTVAALGNGGFVIVHQTLSAAFPGNERDVIFHIVAEDGTVFATNQFVDPSGTLGDEVNPAVIGLANGGFMVAWTDSTTGTLFARTFDGLGNATSDTMIVASGVETGLGNDIEMTLMADGRVAVTWSTDEGGLDPNGSGTYFTILDPRDGQVFGGPGPDVLYGSTGNDNVSAGAGSDFIDAMAGNDFVDAGADSDTILGGEGDDILLGGGSFDTLFGEEGNDRLEGGQDADILDGGLGTDTASYMGSAGGVVVNLAFNIGQSNDAAGDSFISIENVWGSNFNDIIRGTSGVNELHGAGGGDQLLGDAGNDALIGGRGNDILRGGAGADALNGGSGFDVADYSDSPARVLVNLFFGNALEGDAAGDLLFGMESVFGSAFDDIMRGSTGNNALRGNGGNDTLTGDGGADLFQYADTNWGQDLITDFTDGVDQLDLRGSGLTFSSLTIAVSGGDTFVSITGIPGQAIKLDNFVGTLNASDFLF